MFAWLSTIVEYNSVMEKQTLTVAEYLARKDSEEVEDYSEHVIVPAGQEWPNQQVTQVIHKTVVVHKYDNPPQTKKKRTTAVVAKFLLKEGLLYREHKEESGWHLPEEICKVLNELIKADHQFVPTKRLFALGGYAKKNTFKSHRQRLKAWGRKKDGGGLNCNIIEGDTVRGSKIPVHICIQRVPTGTR